MIPESTSLKIFEDYEPLQTHLGKHFGILLKGDGMGEQKYVHIFRSSLKRLTEYYKPHIIKHSNYWRWSFAIPFEQDENKYVGINLIVEWHRNSPHGREIEYLTIKSKRKTWGSGHLPPCFWKN